MKFLRDLEALIKRSDVEIPTQPNAVFDLDRADTLDNAVSLYVEALRDDGTVEVLVQLKDRDRREFMRLLRLIRKLLEQRAAEARAAGAGAGSK